MNWHFTPPLQPFNTHKNKHKQSLTLNKKKMIVNKRKPWTKNHSPKKNDDNNNDNNLCFCYNATTHIDYDWEQKLTMHIHE
jgi:hypothetical protein